LKKAEKKVAERGVHRRLVKNDLNVAEAREHIANLQVDPTEKTSVQIR
jgi:hypothetical protein